MKSSDTTRNLFDLLAIHDNICRQHKKTASPTSAVVPSAKAEDDDAGLHPPPASSEVQAKTATAATNNNTFYFYLVKAIPILDAFQKHLKKEKEKKVMFLQPYPLVSSSSCEELDSSISEYLQIVKTYFPSFYECHLLEDGSLTDHKADSSSAVLSGGGAYGWQRCTNCGLKQNGNIFHDNYFICEECGFMSQQGMMNPISFKDINRVNITTKFQYDRITHFRDCINQFQAKQNATIDQKVYDDLITEFLNHDLIPQDYKSVPKEEAFKNVTKDHVLLFLKERHYTKHYEDVVLIHHQLTGCPVPDISHLEPVLLQDFEQITALYDREYRNSERKNFINTQYILYQLLRRHKFPCKKEDFNILKTIDRKYYHDDITVKLFSTLEFQFSPTF